MELNLIFHWKEKAKDKSNITPKIKKMLEKLFLSITQDSISFDLENQNYNITYKRLWKML